MNVLLAEIVRSLNELSLGFQGELTMSDAMDSLVESLYLDRVPAGQLVFHGFLTRTSENLKHLSSRMDKEIVALTATAGELAVRFQ